jgi:hypothetical protein
MNSNDCNNTLQLQQVQVHGTGEEREEKKIDNTEWVTIATGTLFKFLSICQSNHIDHDAEKKH